MARTKDTRIVSLDESKGVCDTRNIDLSEGRIQRLRDLFIDGDETTDPVGAAHLAGNATSCMVGNLAAIARAAAAAHSSDVGLAKKDVTAVFYGLAEMAELFDVLKDIKDNAEYQIRKRGPDVSVVRRRTLFDMCGVCANCHG